MLHRCSGIKYLECDVFGFKVAGNVFLTGYGEGHGPRLTAQMDGGNSCVQRDQNIKWKIYSML